MWFRPFKQNLKKSDFWQDKAFKQISGRKRPFRKNTWVIISKGREISHQIQNQSRKVRPLLIDGYYPFTYIQGFFTARNKRWNSKEIQSHRYHRENSGFLYTLGIAFQWVVDPSTRYISFFKKDGLCSLSFLLLEGAMSLIPRTDRSIVFGPVNNRLLYLGTNFSALVPSCGSDKGCEYFRFRHSSVWHFLCGKWDM